ncbi:ATP-binding protein [Streptomyces sp. NPDC001795]|uniref:ATP-binding protein n=1 Tax=Streptomyces sp. NPDC001795 TaxID=3154525 RepID=UPI003331BC49
MADEAAPGSQRPAAPPALDAALATMCVESFVGGPWSLPWSPTACALARTAIRDVLPQWGLGSLVPTAELLVSELVCNALRHAVGPLSLTLERVSDVRCLVSDGSLAPPRPTDADPEDETGRGLALVDMLAARWGCERGPVGKSVWFELCVEADTTHTGGSDVLDGRATTWTGETGPDRPDPLTGDRKSEAA